MSDGDWITQVTFPIVTKEIVIDLRLSREYRRIALMSLKGIKQSSPAKVHIQLLLDDDWPLDLLKLPKSELHRITFYCNDGIRGELRQRGLGRVWEKIAKANESLGRNVTVRVEHWPPEEVHSYFESLCL